MENIPLCKVSNPCAKNITEVCFLEDAENSKFCKKKIAI
jgi:hypothetical protein